MNAKTHIRGVDARRLHPRKHDHLSPPDQEHPSHIPPTGQARRPPARRTPPSTLIPPSYRINYISFKTYALLTHHDQKIRSLPCPPSPGRRIRQGVGSRRMAPLVGGTASGSRATCSSLARGEQQVPDGAFLLGNIARDKGDRDAAESWFRRYITLYQGMAQPLWHPCQPWRSAVGHGQEDPGNGLLPRRLEDRPPREVNPGRAGERAKLSPARGWSGCPLAE